VIDIAQERARLSKEQAKLEGEIAAIDKKLASPQFTSKAPPEVVDEQRSRREAASLRRERLSAALGRLS
jgi:valyl-tRNA synthetase